jgi:pantoate--beta-alanine ligase
VPVPVVLPQAFNTPMLVLHTLSDLAAAARARPTPGEGLGGVLVPTMGALHAGHTALIRRGSALALERKMPAGCIVSIFVNPTQFDDPADFQRYPRTMRDDLATCREAGASMVFAPSPEVMYPPELVIPTPPLPEVATRPGLEDAHRPGHFAGVCQVVRRLFDLLRPTAALFGEKDWQQLRTIEAMTCQELLPIEIIAFPTLRDSDGLAMSSRNRFLSPTERRQALAIPEALCQAYGCSEATVAEARMREVMAEAGLTIDYAVIRDAGTLLGYRPSGTGAPGRALIAARAGATRLIDNAAWPA